MVSMVKLIALAALLCIAHGQSQTASTGSSMPVVNPTSTPTTQPPPTTAAPPPFPTNDSYILKDKDTGKVCLHMVAGLGIIVPYHVTSENKDRNTTFDFMRSASVDKSQSHCNMKTWEATLVVQYIPTKNPYYVTFNFERMMAPDGSVLKTWNITEVSIQFTFNKTDFPGYTGSTPADNTVVMSSSNTSVFDNGDVGANQSFVCASNRTLDGFTPLAPQMNISLFMTEVQIQAFEFTNPNTGAFDAGQVYCLLDRPYTGNKIVPIAVGAALAGLVIVVLVAYLIGRLRNRKKSSYEALS